MHLTHPAHLHDLTTGRGRLRYLADVVLARVTETGAGFDLRWWFSDRDGCPTNECGTVACAVGWGAHDLLLRAAGLNSQGMWLAYGELWNWDAVQSFFGLSAGAALYLFNEDSYPSRSAATAADVAARIREHLEGA